MTAKEYMQNHNGKPAWLIEATDFNYSAVKRIVSAGNGLVTIETRLHRLFRCDDAEIVLCSKKN